MLRIYLTGFFLFFLHSQVWSQAFKYLYPVPGTSMHKIETKILIRPGYSIPNSFFKALQETEIKGSKSGDHKFKIKLVENGKTILIDPLVPFSFGETIEVLFPYHNRDCAGFMPGNLDFHFSTESDHSTQIDKIRWIASEEFEGMEKSEPPPSFPETDIILNGETGDGAIYGSTGFNVFDLFILDNQGDPLFLDTLDFFGSAHNFRYVHDNLYVYANIIDQWYVGLDSNFEVIDTFKCVGGLDTDFHDFQLTSSGNAVLLSFDPQTVDMSLIVPGGDPNAVVSGLVIQEIDPQDNLVFQWRSWDHFEITDGLYTGSDTMDFTASTIPYVHANSLEIDSDANWIISSRHMGEVTKISRVNGEIIWRLGGKNNQFTFVNDSLNGFTHQHDARRTSQGTITIFDNGIFHDPPLTRILEYDLDTSNMTATLVWEYHNPYGDVTQISGNAQRLENGNTFINWGKRTTTPIPNDYFLEIDSIGNTIFQMSFLNPGEMGWIYRAYRLPWNGTDMTTSIRPVYSTLADFQISPNPVSDRLKLSIYSLDSGPAKFSIFNSSGRLMQKFNQHLQTGLNLNLEFGIPELSNGVYFLEVESNGQRLTRKFVVLK